jgi:hypothetical protein
MRYDYGIYPEVIDLPYSMPREANPHVEVAIHDMFTSCTEYVDLQSFLGHEPEELIITEVFWSESGELGIRATDRLQQNQWFADYSLSTVFSSSSVTEFSPNEAKRNEN